MTPPHTSKSILVVEDEEQLLMLLATFLESEKLTVLKARDGATALRLFREQHQDIAAVVTDLGLPELEGVELIKVVKKEDPSMLVIGVSGLGGANVRSLALQAGADKFFHKPFKLREMLQAILGGASGA